MRTVTVAAHAGFCAGVKRSVALAEKALSEHDTVWCLGELIHNRQEMERLAALGLRTAARPEDVPDGAAVLLRAHGEGRAVPESLAARGCTVVDTTCPRVSRIQRLAADAAARGRVVRTVGELERLLTENSKFTKNDLTLLFQSTETRRNFELSENSAKKLCTNPEIFDTICDATQIRQTEALDLGQKCDAVVVIGGKHSANSRHLTEICAEVCPCVLFVESAEELDLSPLVALDTIGITAGASVPERIIKEVKQKMCDEIKETTAVETEKSFEEMLEDSIKPIYNGETVKGVVVAITPTEVTVDLGTKHSGYIPVEEFEDESGAKVEDILHVGDEVEACVVRVNDVEGTVMLSKRRLDAVKNWADIEAAAENETVVEGTVTEENKGGLVVNVKGVRVFVPASQSGLPREAELAQLLKQKVQLRITEVNKAARRSPRSGTRSRSASATTALSSPSPAMARLSTSAAWTAWSMSPS